MSIKFEIGETYKKIPHLLADLTELLLLLEYLGKKELHSNDIEGVLQNNIRTPEELDESEAGSEFMSSAEKNDVSSIALDDLFDHLSYREYTFGKYYPFKIEGKKIRRIECLSAEQKIYLFLLACSRLRSFSQESGVRQKWANSFTRLSKVALEGLFPVYADVKIFDAHSEDRKNYYGHQLCKALKVLGKDMAVRSINEDSINAISLHDMGDAGIDLVAMVNFQDNARNSYVMLAQCAAQGNNWPKKRFEGSSPTLRAHFQMLYDMPSVLFISVCYRQSTGEWFNLCDISGTFILDRERIIYLIEQQNRAEEVVGQTWFCEFISGFQDVEIDKY